MCLHADTRVHADGFAHRAVTRRTPFTQRSPCTEQLLTAEVFTQTGFDPAKLAHTHTPTRTRTKTLLAETYPPTLAPHSCGIAANMAGQFH